MTSELALPGISCGLSGTRTTNVPMRTKLATTGITTERFSVDFVVSSKAAPNT
jgi:hypothetical protein